MPRFINVWDKGAAIGQCEDCKHIIYNYKEMLHHNCKEVLRNRAEGVEYITPQEEREGINYVNEIEKELIKDPKYIEKLKKQFQGVTDDTASCDNQQHVESSDIVSGRQQKGDTNATGKETVTEQ